jgi:hypothetical protein
MSDSDLPEPQADGAGARKPPQPPVTTADAGEPPRRRKARALAAAFREAALKRRSS